MSKDKTNTIPFSDETQEILDKMPSNLLRVSLFALWLIIIGIIVLCCFIPYPQTVQGTITITTLNPPIDIKARTTGKIDSLFVKNNQQVHKNEKIILIHSTAQEQDIENISDSLQKTYDQPPKKFVFQGWIRQNFCLGDIQEHYEIFRNKCMEYRHYIERDFITKQKQLLQAQIKKQEQQYKKLQQQQKKQKQDFEYARSMYMRDSILFAEGQIISAQEYEQSKRKILQTEQEHINFEANLLAQQRTILQQKQQIIELDIQQDNEIAEYERLINQYRQQLQTALVAWKNNYLLVSPIDGKVTMMEYWSDQQTVMKDERVVTIVPNDTMRVIGKMYITSANFGKVRENQMVNIKLNSFPYMEYGILKGKIKSIAGVPTQEKGYMAEVELPYGLVTTYHKSLSLIQQTDGIGEIIIKDLNLMQRLLQPIRALFDK